MSSTRTRGHCSTSLQCLRQKACRHEGSLCARSRRSSRGAAGLPGPSPQAVVACQHKLTSRAIQRRVAPHATPRFRTDRWCAVLSGALVREATVGRLSQEARRIDDAPALATLVEEPRYRDGYGRLAELAGLAPEAVHGFLVEELVEGDEVTLEGYVHRGRVTVVGVTDSVKYEGTNSFERFEYPSALARNRLDELASLAESIVLGHGLDDCFFNVEFLVPTAGPAMIVEVNARIASQFAPLVEAVHGRSTYDALFTLACGDDPAWSGKAARGVAVSYVVRVFADALVDGRPDPQAGLEVLVRPGLRLRNRGRTIRRAIALRSSPSTARPVKRRSTAAWSVLARFASSSRAARKADPADERAEEGEPGGGPHSSLERVRGVCELTGTA